MKKSNPNNYPILTEILGNKPENFINASPQNLNRDRKILALLKEINNQTLPNKAILAEKEILARAEKLIEETEQKKFSERSPLKTNPQADKKILPEDNTNSMFTNKILESLKKSSSFNKLRNTPEVFNYRNTSLQVEKLLDNNLPKVYKTRVSPQSSNSVNVKYLKTLANINLNYSPHTHEISQSSKLSNPHNNSNTYNSTTDKINKSTKTLEKKYLSSPTILLPQAILDFSQFTKIMDTPFEAQDDKAKKN